MNGPLVAPGGTGARLQVGSFGVPARRFPDERPVRPDLLDQRPTRCPRGGLGPGCRSGASGCWRADFRTSGTFAPTYWINGPLVAPDGTAARLQVGSLG